MQHNYKLGSTRFHQHGATYLPPSSPNFLYMSIRPAAGFSVNVPFTRAVGTVRLAVEFLIAAKAQDLTKNPPSLVAHFLFGHALELAFKAVLIAHGTTDKTLRRLGHDLRAARNA